MKTKIEKHVTHTYANDNKLFRYKWSTTTIENNCLFENLTKKNKQLNKLVTSKKSSVTDATPFINRHLEISNNGN